MGFVQCMPKRALHSAPPGALLPHIRGWEVYARVPVCACACVCVRLCMCVCRGLMQGTVASHLTASAPGQAAAVRQVDMESHGLISSTGSPGVA